MKVTSLAAALVAAASMVPTMASQCFESYQCIFRHNVGSTEYSWNMGQLCQEAGDEYVYNNPSNGQQFYFNVCGNVSQLCVPSYPVYSNAGVAVQFLSAAPPPGSQCTDVNGNPAPCTGQCAVLGTQFMQFGLINPSDPTQGVIFRHAGMPPDADDAFPCPALTPEGLTQERQLSINIACDSGVSGLRLLNINETSPCIYAIYASSSAACPTTGDPYDCQPYISGQGGRNFGFVVLGSFLTIFVWWLTKYLNARGYLDPVKEKLRDVPVIGKFIPTSGLGSYKTITSNSNVTPITASAYGTA